MIPYKPRYTVKVRTAEWPDSYRLNPGEYLEHGVFLNLMVLSSMEHPRGHFTKADGVAMSVEEIAAALPGNPVEVVRALADRHVLKKGVANVLYIPEVIHDFKMREVQTINARSRTAKWRDIISQTDEAVFVRRLTGAGLDVMTEQMHAIRRLHRGIDWKRIVDEVIAAHREKPVENAVRWMSDRIAELEAKGEM